MCREHNINSSGDLCRAHIPFIRHVKSDGTWLIATIPSSSTAGQHQVTRSLKLWLAKSVPATCPAKTDRGATSQTLNRPLAGMPSTSAILGRSDRMSSGRDISASAGHRRTRAQASYGRQTPQPPQLILHCWRAAGSSPGRHVSGARPSDHWVSESNVRRRHEMLAG